MELSKDPSKVTTVLVGVVPPHVTTQVKEEVTVPKVLEDNLTPAPVPVEVTAFKRVVPIALAELANRRTNDNAISILFIFHLQGEIGLLGVAP